MGNDLRREAVRGVLWSAIERFSVQIVQFMIHIILARLLLPSDFGLIGMLAIFLQISQLLIDGGFSNALIQKQDRTEIDFSTVFYFNMFISIALYCVLFWTAPFIANFYHIPELSSVVRVIALNLVISSFFAIPKVKLMIAIDFKSQLKISLVSILVSGVVGVLLAYKGFGVWALVMQSLLNNLFLCILFCVCFRWFPLYVFSGKSFRSLFFFGSKLTLSSLIHTVYYNLYSIVIGRYFSATALGYFRNAEQFASLPSSGINMIISRVSYPVLSRIQDDDEYLARAYRKYIRLSSFLIFPLMFCLAALADPIVNFLLTDKWSEVIPLFRILCLCWMLDHLSVINLNLLFVKGRTDLSLRLELVKKTIATIILFASIPFGLEGMCWGRVFYYIIATYINTYYTNRLIGLSFLIQLHDIIPYWILSLVMALCVYGISLLFLESYFQIMVGVVSCVLIYYMLSYLFTFKTLKEFVLLFK